MKSLRDFLRCMLLVFALPVVSLASDYVSLTNQEGRLIEARLLELSEEKVKLEPRGDYRSYDYPLADLSVASQEYVRQHFSTTQAPLNSGFTEPEAKPRPKRYDIDLVEKFEDWDLEPRHQGMRGTCSIFAITHLLDYTLARAGAEEVISPEFLNWCADRADQRNQDGAFFHHALQGLATYGFVMEEDLPYRRNYQSDWQPDEDLLTVAAKNRTLLTDQLDYKVHWIRSHENASRGLSEQHLNDIIDALERGYPVAIGGTHSLCVLGYEGRGGDDKRGTFHVVDSARAHFKELDYEYMTTEAIEAFYIEIAPGSSAEPLTL